MNIAKRKNWIEDLEGILKSLANILNNNKIIEVI